MVLLPPTQCCHGINCPLRKILECSLLGAIHLTVQLKFDEAVFSPRYKGFSNRRWHCWLWLTLLWQRCLLCMYNAADRRQRWSLFNGFRRWLDRLFHSFILLVIGERQGMPGTVTSFLLTGVASFIL